jgi:putative transposase
LTEAVRIVTRVARQVQVSAGGVYNLGYHVVWCPKYRRPVVAGAVAGRCEALIRAKAAGHGWPMVTLEIMLSHVHLFVTAHRSDSPSQVARQFKGFTSRHLRAGFPHPRSWLPTLWSRSYSTATADAVSTETVRQHIDTQDERRGGRNGSGEKGL